MNYTKYNFHNESMDGNFFEGWYFKHTFDNQVFCLIPGISIDKNDVQTFFLQIIGNFGSRFITYEKDECYFDKNKMLIKIGDCVFTDKGVRINIQKNGLCIQGKLRYGEFAQLKNTLYAPSIMGPFSYLKFLECYHDIISLKHTVIGKLTINGSHVVCQNGIGYIEKDWGISMPKSWTWLKCNEFKNNKNACLMISLAVVPIKKMAIKGIIAICQLDNKQYRFATYYGAKSNVKTAKDGSIIIHIRQGKIDLVAKIYPNNPVQLKAPVNGQMKRTIVEYNSCKCSLKLIINKKILFESIGKNAGYEDVNNIK